MAVQKSIQEWQNIAYNFRPIVELCDGGNWQFDFIDEYRPSTVEWYLARCTLRVRGNDHVAIPHPSGSDLLRYNQSDAYLDPSANALEGDQATAVFYVHVAAGNGDTVDLQYWFFYPNNGKTSTVVNPRLAIFGSHEGDWEHVVVRVNAAATRIIGVYFAAHGSEEGGWVYKSTTGKADADHYRTVDGRPVVYSAWHSHASYPDIAVHWRTATFFVSNDVTVGGNTWAGDIELIAIDAALLPSHSFFQEPDWLHWKGRWGSTQESLTHWFGNSPEGPSYGAAWSVPHHPGQWTQPIRLATSGLALREVVAALSPPGELAAMVVPRVGGLGWTHQIDGGWSDLATFMGGIEGGVSRLHVVETSMQVLSGFVLSGGGLIIASSQVIENGAAHWAGDWEAIASKSYAVMAAGVDDQGRVHVLGLSPDGLDDIVQSSSDPRSPWGEPVTMLGAGARNVLAHRAQDDRLMAIIDAGPELILGIYATSGWQFTRTLPVGYAPAAFTQNGDGRIEIFGLDGAGAVWHCWQTVPGPMALWSGWSQLKGVTGIAQLVVDREANGRLALFARAGNGNVHWTRQAPESGNGWQAWAQVAVAGARSISVGKNTDGRLELFIVQGNTLLHAWETSPLI